MGLDKALKMLGASGGDVATLKGLHAVYTKPRTPDDKKKARAEMEKIAKKYTKGDATVAALKEMGIS